MSLVGLIGVALHLSDSLKSSSGTPDEAQAPKERVEGLCPIPHNDACVRAKRDCSKCPINLLF